MVATLRFAEQYCAGAEIVRAGAIAIATNRISREERIMDVGRWKNGDRTPI